MAIRVIFALLICLLPTPYTSAQDEIRPDLKSFFDEYKVTGAFVMYDRNAAKWIRYNPPFAQKRLPPASTFDIANTLIGFETGVLSQGFLFRWNGEKRLFKSWERDLDIRDAFQNSCLPCFHQLSQAIGLERMQSYLDKLRYGNGVIDGRGETFWMKGGLRISADEQVEFLRSLYDEKLMLSPRSMKEVKAMLLRDDTPRYKLFGKTGWLADDLADPIGKPSLGWFVGFQERAGNVYFFATIIETEKTQADFASARVDISKRILKQLCVIE